MTAPARTEKIALLKGGWSAERAVSLNSAVTVAEALRAAGFTVAEIDVTRDLAALVRDLAEAAPAAVFNALHGKGGEDGVMQGVLAMLDLPVTHSSLLPSALAMDKHRTKDLLQTKGMPCAEGILTTAEAFARDGAPLPPPYVIKPNAEGSSLGVHIVQTNDTRPLPSFEDIPPDTTILVEAFIPGRELTVAALGAEGCPARALTVTEIKARSSFYDYEAKYSHGGSEHLIPAPVNGRVFEEARRLAVLAHESLGCAGVTRCDFRYDDSKPGTDGLVFLEINTQPGMTATSLVPEQAAACGISFPTLAAWLVDEALWRHRRRQDGRLLPPAIPAFSVL